MGLRSLESRGKYTHRQNHQFFKKYQLEGNVFKNQFLSHLENLIFNIFNNHTAYQNDPTTFVIRMTTLPKISWDKNKQL